MAFKNLEQRFNEKVNELYDGAKLKFDNGRLSRGANDDPLIVRKPGDGYFNGISRSLGRFLPVASALQDVKRITLFTLSVRGIVFLAKQQLLQTGNTFEQTRLINPLFAIGSAAAPGLGNIIRIKRHLRPITGGPGGSLLGKTDASYANVRKIGQLQKSTYDSFTTNSGGGPGAFFKKLAGPITSTISAFTAKKNVGEEFGNWNEESWKKSRPELGQSDKDYVVGFKAPRFTFGGAIDTAYFNGNNYGTIPRSPGTWDGKYKTYLKFSNDQLTWTHTTGKASEYSKGINLPIIPDETEVRQFIAENAENQLVPTENTYRADVGQIDQLLKDIRGEYKSNRENWYNQETGKDGPMPYLKYFTGDQFSITKGAQFDYIDSTGTNARDAANVPTRNKKISYIKDPSNEVTKNPSNSAVYRPAYAPINSNFDDPIVVSFAMGKEPPIRFRAFITELNENTSPQYQSFQYIGRVEKFINYTGVQREASFKLAIIAFSKDELGSVWRRINYLTGLAFPYGFTKGLLQPNIVRLTIGNVYSDQPGYISSLGKTFNQISETWDLDDEVPIAATIDVKFTIIEKSTKIAESPFYGITEEMGGFSKTLNVPRDTPPGPADAPGDPQQVPVDTRGLQGFDQQDRDLTAEIVRQSQLGNATAVTQLGTFQARRREAVRAAPSILSNITGR